MSRILVVDDEIHIRMLYAKELEDDGYDVTVAATPQEALQALRVSRTDLVVLDIELEDCNGLDLLNRIRQEFHDIFVVINSAYSTYKSDFQTWLADAYIMKSSDLKPLKEKVRELLAEGACDRTV